jgi:hypothetical protein
MGAGEQDLTKQPLRPSGSYTDSPLMSPDLEIGTTTRLGSRKVPNT